MGTASPSMVLVQAGHDLEQGALARAVDTQHADLGAREEGQADVLQDLPLRRHDLADAVHGKDVLGHGRGCPVARAKPRIIGDAGDRRLLKAARRISASHKGLLEFHLPVPNSALPHRRA
jgi:hypothetical protein